MLTRIVHFVLLLLIVASPNLAAQVVQGSVLETDSRKSIPGALVRLVDAAGHSVAEALTSAGGAFRLTAPAAGRFRLNVERVGFRSELSEVIALAAGEVTEYTMAIRSAPTTLEGITVRGESRGCSIPANGETVARVWDEARKALRVLALTQSSALVRFDTEMFRRELDPVSRRTRIEQRQSAFDRVGNPFHSLPVEELIGKGFVRPTADSTVYYAPDAAVLLSDAFLDSHCFRLETEVADDAGLIGLAFRPVRGISRPDIAGTIWIDRGTSELRAVDFRYVGHVRELPASQMGGRIEFERVVSGAWIVRSWVIRMPIMIAHRTPGTGTGESRVDAYGRIDVAGVVERGGRVVAVSTTAASRPSSGQSSLSGIVFDSLAGRPLAGAFVYLSGTGLADTTDASGEYHIAHVPPGRHIVSFAHPKVTALGIIPASPSTTIDAAFPASLDLSIPSSGTLLRNYCPEPVSDGEGMLAGIVREVGTGRPVGGALLRLTWTADSRLHPESLARRVGRSGNLEASVDGARISVIEGTREVNTDAAGFFRVCRLPLNTSVEIETRAGSASSRHVVKMERDRVAARELTVDLR